MRKTLPKENLFLKLGLSSRPKKSELLFAFDRLTTSSERNGVRANIMWKLQKERGSKFPSLRVGKQICNYRWEEEEGEGKRCGTQIGRRWSESRRPKVSEYRGQTRPGRWAIKNKYEIENGLPT